VQDYVYAIAPLLEDAMMDRDPVHRQTAAWAIKHLALGLQGLGCEDALQHLLNHVWPNIYETSPHVTQAVFEAVESLRVSLGPQRIFSYVLQVCVCVCVCVLRAFLRVRICVACLSWLCS
jgi:splicing factor 3B subunit 1